MTMNCVALMRLSVVLALSFLPASVRGQWVCTTDPTTEAAKNLYIPTWNSHSGYKDLATDAASFCGVQIQFNTGGTAGNTGNMFHFVQGSGGGIPMDVDATIALPNGATGLLQYYVTHTGGVPYDATVMLCTDCSGNNQPTTPPPSPAPTPGPTPVSATPQPTPAPTPDPTPGSAPTGGGNWVCTTDPATAAAKDLHVPTWNSHSGYRLLTTNAAAFCGVEIVFDSGTAGTSGNLLFFVPDSAGPTHVDVDSHVELPIGATGTLQYYISHVGGAPYDATVMLCTDCSGNNNPTPTTPPPTPNPTPSPTPVAATPSPTPSPTPDPTPVTAPTGGGDWVCTTDPVSNEARNLNVPQWNSHSGYKDLTNNAGSFCGVEIKFAGGTASTSGNVFHFVPGSAPTPMDVDSTIAIPPGSTGTLQYYVIHAVGQPYIATVMLCTECNNGGPTAPPPPTPNATPAPTPATQTCGGGSTGPIVDGTMPVEDTSGQLVTGQQYAAGNNNVELSSGFGTWSTKSGVVGTLSQCCIEMHDSYWTVFEGKVYHTWHPVGAIHPNGEGCVWGHEHGNNPFLSPLFGYSGGWPAFASVMETFNDNEVGGQDHCENGLGRCEDHFGHKVTVATYRATIGNPPNTNETLMDAGFFCHFLSKVHQGSYSNDALTNQLHEYFINAQCDDNPVGLFDRITNNMSVQDRFSNPNNIKTQFAIKSMVPFGAPNQVSELECGTGLLTFGVNMNSELDPEPPLAASVTPNIQVDSIDGANALNHRGLGCIKESAAKYSHGFPDTIGEVDLWTQPRNIKAPPFAGTEANVQFQAYYNVKDSIRLYDAAENKIRYTVDICNDLPSSFEFCTDVTSGMQWTDPDSPFKGALRSVHFKTFAMFNNQANRPEEFCTNSFGRDPVATDANGNCPTGYILQKIKPFQGNNDWFGFENPVTGITGPIVGALYVVGQQMTYPFYNPSTNLFELISGTTPSGLIKPSDPSTMPPGYTLPPGQNCPLGFAFSINNNEQLAYCAGGIGFEKVVDLRDAVPDSVVQAVLPGYNTAIHGPN